MAVQTIETLKEKFKSGSFPTQQDYHDVFDSFLSKGESLTTDDIKGTGDSSELNLTQILASLDIPTVPEGLDEFIEKVNSFLEDTDVADETINKWKEIESFLTGITDTETLTGLLASLKAEILAEQLVTTATELYCTNDFKIVVYNGELKQTKKAGTYVQGTQGPLYRPHTYPVGTKVVVGDGKKYIYAGKFKIPMYTGDDGSLVAKTYYYIPVGYVIGDWMTGSAYRQGHTVSVIKDTQKYYWNKFEQEFDLYESEDGKFYFLYGVNYQSSIKYVLLKAFREQSFNMGITTPIKEPLELITINSYSEATLEEEFSSNVGHGKFECSWVSEWGNVSLSESEVKKIVAENIPEQKEYTAGDGIEISESGVISAVKEVSNKKFCEIIDDLDASDAEVGTIAMYGGKTNEKYTHGFIYEKVEGGEGGGIVIPANNKGIRIAENDYGIPAGTYYPDLSTTWDASIRESSNGYKALDKCFWEVGKDDVVWDGNGNYHTIAEIGDDLYEGYLKLDSTDSDFINFGSSTAFKACKFYKEDDPTKSILCISVFYMYTDEYPTIGFGELVDVNGVVICKMSGPKYSNAFITKGVIPTNSEEIVVPTISWTPLNVMNVIN